MHSDAIKSDCIIASHKENPARFAVMRSLIYESRREDKDGDIYIYIRFDRMNYLGVRVPIRRYGGWPVKFLAPQSMALSPYRSPAFQSGLKWPPRRRLGRFR